MLCAVLFQHFSPDSKLVKINMGQIFPCIQGYSSKTFLGGVKSLSIFLYGWESQSTDFFLRDVRLKQEAHRLNGHLSIRDFTLTSCQKGSYLYINSPIIE